ncbi:MAG: mechanosensitive ion channel [Mariprofundaceae bacterium]|nr:mechanosensitive ion channel [Mariprofundaceae bacterium]
MQALPDISSTPLFSIFGTTVTAGHAVSAMLTLLLGLWLSRKMKQLVIARAPRFDINQSTANTIATMVFYLGTVISVLLAVSLLGIEIQNMVVLAGALSVGIGFGLQNIANNFVSGLILLFDRSLKVGDYIELADGLRGTITQIRVRSTIVMTNDHLEVIVPNSGFISGQVINYTLSSDRRRLHVPFSVAYGSDVQHVIDTVLKVPASLGFVIHDNPEWAPKVWMTSMADSSLNFELLVWIHGQASGSPSGTLSECLLAVHRALIENGIQIPFPQRDIHIRETPQPLAEKS